MADKTLPLREGECPGGARGYDSVTRHTPPASGHPLYLRGGVCIPIISSPTLRHYQFLTRDWLFAKRSNPAESVPERRERLLSMQNDAFPAKYTCPIRKRTEEGGQKLNRWRQFLIGFFSHSRTVFSARPSRWAISRSEWPLYRSATRWT